MRGKKAQIAPGQRFGMLTVQYESPERDKHGAVMWHCICDCGKEKDASSGKLISGWVTSCGCRLSFDLSGQRYGRWTVMYRAGSTNAGIIWHCRCDCGNEKDVLGRLLRTGESKSCGCLRKKKEASSQPIKKKQKKPSIIEGEKYNRLTAIKPMGSNKYKQPLWLFKCDCGKEHITIANAVRRGEIKSCGCMLTEFLQNRAYDLKGQRFGKLVCVRQLPERNKDGDVLWECVCDCGRTTQVRTYHLTNGNVQSCGCLSSKGELLISRLLSEQHLSFETQKIFDDCRFPDTNYPAKFDFWVNNQYIVEYDGEQHYPIERDCDFKKWQPFDYVRKHDQFKNAYCKKTGKPIIRIPYTHLKDLCIEDLLLETTKFRVA